MVIGQIDWSSGQFWSTPRARAPPPLRDVAAPPGRWSNRGLFHRSQIIARILYTLYIILLYYFVLYIFSQISSRFPVPFVLYIIIVYHIHAWHIKYYILGRPSHASPRSRLTFRKIKTRIVGCKTPRRCQEITAICRPFVVAQTHQLLHHYRPPTYPPANPRRRPDSKKRNKQESSYYTSNA